MSSDNEYRMVWVDSHSDHGVMASNATDVITEYVERAWTLKHVTSAGTDRGLFLTFSRNISVGQYTDAQAEQEE